MPNLLTNLPHMIMATIVIAAVVILTATHNITGAEGLIVITGAGGFTLGAGAGSTSGTNAAPTVSVTSSSTGLSPATVITPAQALPTSPSTTTDTTPASVA